jgi:hypothetical protein
MFIIIFKMVVAKNNDVQILSSGFRDNGRQVFELRRSVVPMHRRVRVRRRPTEGHRCPRQRSTTPARRPKHSGKIQRRLSR